MTDATDREEEQIAADIARTNQERDEKVGCPVCGSPVSKRVYSMYHELPDDPFAGVRAGHALLDDVKRIFGAGVVPLDDVTRFYEDTLDMNDPTRASVVVRRYFSRFANGGTPEDRIALLHILNEVYKF